MQNIRDTNWLLFSSDYEHCWMANNYDSSCIDGSASGYTDGSYILLQNSNNRWYLTGSTSSGIYLDSNGLSYQTGANLSQSLCSHANSNNCKTLFSRLISLSYPGSSTGSIDITSLVQWSDVNSSSPHTINLKTTLTNWK